MAENRNLQSLADALESLKTSLQIVASYRIENAKLVAGLMVVIQMARSGASNSDIAKFAEQALAILGKKKP